MAEFVDPDNEGEFVGGAMAAVYKIDQYEVLIRSPLDHPLVGRRFNYEIDAGQSAHILREAVAEEVSLHQDPVLRRSGRRTEGPEDRVGYGQCPEHFHVGRGRQVLELVKYRRVGNNLVRPG